MTDKAPDAKPEAAEKKPEQSDDSDSDSFEMPAPLPKPEQKPREEEKGIKPLALINTDKGKKAKNLPEDVEDEGLKAKSERKRVRAETNLGSKFRGALDDDRTDNLVTCDRKI